MTDHVTYMCRCLNVCIHIAHKYLIGKHEKYKRDLYVTVEEPGISGWKFELDKKGVVVKYPGLVSARRNNNNSLGWITFSCRNCNSGDIYSVCRPAAELSYPVDTTIMSQWDDEVIVQKGTIFGEEIDKARENTAYSSAFQIVLNPDLPITSTSLELEEDGQSDTLYWQQKQLQQLVNQSLTNLKEITEKKIQLYQQEQMRLLNREQSKVKYDAAVLWQTIKEISIEMQDERKSTKEMDMDHAKINSTTADTEIDRLKNTMNANMSKRKSHVYFSHTDKSSSHCDYYESNSISNKEDLFGGNTVPPNNRRSSYILDESALAKSLTGKTHQFMAPSESLTFQRRSSLLPNANQSIHPLADTAADSGPIPLSSNSPSTNYGNDDEDEESESNSKDDESEDMFALDEEMGDSDEDMIATKDRRLSSRRLSTKYIDDDSLFDNSESTSFAQTDSKDLATSLPIGIVQPTPAYADSKIHPINVMYYPSNPVFESDKIAQDKRTRQKSFVGFDSAEADRETSLQLPPLDDGHRYRRKSSSAVTLLKNKKNDHYKREYSRRDNIMNLNFFHEEDEDRGSPMIPPHILAANAISDESEAIFGSVPHNSVRHWPME